MSIGNIAVIELDCIVESNELEFYGEIEDEQLEFDCEVESELVVSGGGNPYLGPYEVTPNQFEQILYTEQKTAISNIVINPIPSNYGLITWNGSTLMVS